MYVYVCITLHKIQIIIILSCFNNYIKSAPQFHSACRKPKTLWTYTLLLLLGLDLFFSFRTAIIHQIPQTFIHIDLIASQICMM